MGVRMASLARYIRATYFPRRFWSRETSYNVSWEDRAVLAAGLIASGSSVLDVGCGRMQLRKHLPEGCTYTPADLTKWTPETIQVDLNRGEFPPGSFDYATILGVLEYLPRAGVTLENAKRGCQQLIVSYCHPNAGRFGAARNSYSVSEFDELLRSSGWSVLRSLPVDVTKNYTQHLYLATRS